MKMRRRDFIKSGAAMAAGTAASGCRKSEVSEDKPHRWIDQSLCIGCGQCVPLCPMGAISLNNDKSSINPDECSECGVCYRSRACPVDAIIPGRLRWPRTLRETFSNPMAVHEDTGVAGRGTEGIKTNDTTGRYRPGFIGVFVELGRPALGTRFRDVERVVRNFRSHGFEVLPDNPVAGLISDPLTGALQPEVLDEKAISVLVEFIIPEGAADELKQIIRELERDVETVFTVSVALRAYHDGTSPLKDLFGEGSSSLPVGKVNLGFASGIAAREE
jgi:ferredoxin